MRTRGRQPRQGRHPRVDLLEAAWMPAGFHLDSVPAEVRDHLEGCPECRAFLDELVATRRLAGALPAEGEVSLMEAQAAVRRAVAAAGRHARVAQSTWRERLGFVLMAGAMLGAQALLLELLEPAGFVVFQVALNWLAPFLFYILFRLDNRVMDKRAGET